MKICYSCFGNYGDSFNVCPKCGHIEITSPAEPIYLYPGTILAGRYVIGEAIGAGGFGIIYKAWDSKLETIVAVKEFFASRMLTRAPGEKEVIINQKSKDEYNYRKDRFLAEARTMAKYGSHRSIANVFEFFEENRTAYIVMELLEGVSLKEYLAKNGGKVSQDLAIMVTNEVGYALKSLHDDGIIHRDVAPDNIYICNGKEIKIKLLDLGAAKLADSTDDVIDIILKPGYSPYEQYDNTNNIGPWSDIYALGATLYEMLTGIKPDESSNRKTEDTVVPPHLIDQSIPESLSNAVMKAMAIDIHMRFKNVVDFLKAVNGERKVKSLKHERMIKRIKRMSGIAAALLIVGGFALYLKKDYDGKREVRYLKKAELTVWYSANKGSDEDLAMQELFKHFTENYPEVTFEWECIPEKDYQLRIKEASEKNDLPNVFESTGVSDDVLKAAKNLENVYDSEQAGECMFLEQCKEYYPDTKRIPLGIVVPMAYVITNGAECIDYSKDTFVGIDDFGNKGKIAVDDDFEELIVMNYGKWNWASKKEFMNNDSNTSAVMLSTTMAMNDVRKTLTNYQKNYVYPSSEKIYCDFTYEWSMGKGSDSEEKASERFLEWMLGNVYQNTLMISRSSAGQIPVNRTSYMTKCEVKFYAPLADEKIYSHFVFEKQE